MSSPLLIDEPPLQVLPSLATAIGLNEAIILQQIHYWLKRSKNRINGHLWVYNSLPQWEEQFPFWSGRTIERSLASLRSSGVVVAEPLSDDPRNRSLYYRIDYDALSSCNVAKCRDASRQIVGMDKHNLSGSLDRTETTSETTGGERAQAPTPPPAARKASKQKMALPDWLKQVKEAGEKAIPDADPVRSYAAQAGIPDDFLLLAWVEFKARYSEPDAKTYTDWRQVFRNAVRGNWLKLWFVNQDGYQLTTTGKQAQQHLERDE